MARALDVTVQSRGKLSPRYGSRRTTGSSQRNPNLGKRKHRDRSQLPSQTAGIQAERLAKVLEAERPSAIRARYVGGRLADVPSGDGRSVAPRSPVDRAPTVIDDRPAARPPSAACAAPPGTSRRYEGSPSGACRGSSSYRYPSSDAVAGHRRS